MEKKRDLEKLKRAIDFLAAAQTTLFEFRIQIDRLGITSSELEQEITGCKELLGSLLSCPDGG